MGQRLGWRRETAMSVVKSLHWPLQWPSSKVTGHKQMSSNFYRLNSKLNWGSSKTFSFKVCRCYNNYSTYPPPIFVLLHGPNFNELAKQKIFLIIFFLLSENQQRTSHQFLLIHVTCFCLANLFISKQISLLSMSMKLAPVHVDMVLPCADICVSCWSLCFLLKFVFPAATQDSSL